MHEFDIKRSERRCCVSQREFQPGDSFYSVLTEQRGTIVRQDFGEDVWQGPPEECVGWWKTRVPTLAALRMKWAPNDVILHYFERLKSDPDKADVRYVLALLMLRRRIVKQVRRPGASSTAKEESGRGESLRLHCPRNQRDYRVPAVELTAERIDAIQQELAELLYGPES